MAPSPMNLLRLPKLRRRDEGELLQEKIPAPGVKSPGVLDLVGDDEVDPALERHMSLPGKTTFWDTTTFFSRFAGCKKGSDKLTTDEEPTNSEDDSNSIDEPTTFIDEPSGPVEGQTNWRNVP